MIENDRTSLNSIRNWPVVERFHVDNVSDVIGNECELTLRDAKPTRRHKSIASTATGNIDRIGMTTTHTLCTTLAHTLHA